MNAVRQAQVSSDRPESWDNLVRSVLVERHSSDQTARRPPTDTPAGPLHRMAGHRR